MTLETHGLRFSVERLVPGHVTRWHRHDAHRLCLILRGRVGEDRRAETDDYGVGAMVYRPADVRHRNRYGPRGAVIVRVEIEPARAEALQLGRALDEPRTLRTPWVAVLGRRLFDALVHPDLHSPLVLEGITLELLGELVRRDRVAENPPPRWLQQVAERLQKELDQPLRLSELAEAAGVHPSHLAKRFRAQHGTSIGEFLRRARVELAAEMLRDSDRSLAEIAQATGFSDQSHLTNVFRRITGRTPGQYRRAFSPEAPL